MKGIKGRNEEMIRLAAILVAIEILAMTDVDTQAVL
jgi:hypothetical protein